MICGACGHKQVDGVQFCQACGVRISEAKAGSQSSGFDQQPWTPLTAQQASFQGAPPPYGFVPPMWIPIPQLRRERVRQNLQPLGITWCLWGVYRLVMGTFAGFWLHAVAHHHAWFWDNGDSFPNFLTAFLPVIAVTLVVMASLSLLTGWGLLAAKPWARALAIIMAILSLIKIPLGTALGIYTLWVLAPRVSGFEYDAIAQASTRRF